MDGVGVTWLPFGPNISVGNPVNPPPNWLDLLERRPDLSSARAEPARMVMTAAKFMRLSQVHTGVNNRVKYTRDLGDNWRVADTQGDCEDYALAKLVRLLDYGWPGGALCITLCIIIGPMRWQAHVVLQVETDHGTWVLDNRMKYPRLWTRLPYRWLRRECPGREDWEMLITARTAAKDNRKRG